MDFSKLSPVNIVNPKGQNFKLKWYPTKQEFKFSNNLFAELQLEYNSLSQFDDPDGAVFLAVCPGNAGVFYKKAQGRTKGKRFKNARLSETCQTLGLPTDLDLRYVGDNNELKMYKVIPRVPSNTAPDASDEAEEQSIQEDPQMDIPATVEFTENDVQSNDSF